MSTNIKIIQNPGDDEKILDLEDTPEIVLIEFSTMIIRHRDLSDPYWQSVLREFNDAIKVKLEKMTDDSCLYDRRSLMEGVAEIENHLNMLAASQQEKNGIPQTE